MIGEMLITAASVCLFLVVCALLLFLLSVPFKRLRLWALALRFVAMSFSVWPVAGILPGAILFWLTGDRAGLIVSLSSSLLVMATRTLLACSCSSPISYIYLAASVLSAVFLWIVATTSRPMACDRWG